VALAVGDYNASGPFDLEYDGTDFVLLNPLAQAMTATVGGLVPTPPNNTTTFLRGDGTFAAPSAQGITLGTPVASTGGTSIDFTSIPAGVKRITITFNGVSLSGTDAFLVQLGDSGGVETTGYKSSLFYYAGASGGASTSTSGFIAGISAGSGGGGNTFHGAFILTRYNASHAWVCNWSLGFQDGNTGACAGGGSKTLSDELDRVRIAATGANTFDAGTINIAYE
jgi:hypothetical protein